MSWLKKIFGKGKSEEEKLYEAISKCDTRTVSRIIREQSDAINWKLV